MNNGIVKKIKNMFTYMDILYTFEALYEEREFAFKLKWLKEAQEFFKSLPGKVQDKISDNIIRVTGGERNEKLFRKLEGTEIWEFRTRFRGMAYRLFSFWDRDGETMIVVTHGIVKKTQKTPRKEIKKAENIRRVWFNSKK